LRREDTFVRRLTLIPAANLLASWLQNPTAMKAYKYQLTVAVLFAVFTCFYPATSSSQTVQSRVLTPQEKELIKVFNGKVKAYVQQREEVRKKVPPLSKDATPEQIQTFQAAFVERLRTARAAAKRGDLFVPPIDDYLRAIIKTEFKGKDRAELRKTVLEADTRGVPLKVNYPFPETKELTEMPPTLLLQLPQLPKEVKYRFVGRSLLLVDTDNGLIVDYMPNALP
jgi:hypothetical protein